MGLPQDAQVGQQEHNCSIVCASQGVRRGGIGGSAGGGSGDGGSSGGSGGGGSALRLHGPDRRSCIAQLQLTQKEEELGRPAPEEWHGRPHCGWEARRGPPTACETPVSLESRSAGRKGWRRLQAKGGSGGSRGGLLGALCNAGGAQQERLGPMKQAVQPVNPPVSNLDLAHASGRHAANAVARLHLVLA